MSREMRNSQRGNKTAPNQDFDRLTRDMSKDFLNRSMALVKSTIDTDKLPNAALQWTLLEKLGEGTYGEVYRAKAVNHSVEAAAKIIRLSSDDLSHEFDIEFSILKKISQLHENLPSFIGIFTDQDEFHVPRIWFVMELCHLGPMTRLLKELVKRHSLKTIEQENLIAYGLQSTLKALQFLHQSGIMHRDVKGGHILFNENYTIKLIDFGSGALFDSEKAKRNSSVGTPLWMAPEVIACAHQLDCDFDERCDIWSLGITAIELADGQAPLSHLHSNKVLFEIPRRPPPTVQDTSQWSEGFVQFISACLVKDYEHRPRAEQLLAEQSFVTFDGSTHDVYRDLLRTCHLRYLSLNLPNKFVESDRSTTINEDDAMNRNPWIANISRSADVIDRENNLAQLTDLDQQSLMSSIRRRFNQALIYTYVGDVLLAINPKQFLPIDNFNFQLKYSRARRDLLPHIFAVATTVYNQMTINRQPQCIILSGESGSGKTHAAQNLISELALLGFGEQQALENRLVTMNFLLEAFGNAQTVLNPNSSRFGKLLEIFFSEYGTIVYVQLSEFLLEKTRVVLANGNRRNFHILYSIQAHFSANQTNPCPTLTGHAAFDLFRTSSTYTYLGKHQDPVVACFPLVDLFGIFQELNVTEEEQTSILSILAAIIHLGNITFRATTEADEPGCTIEEPSMVHVEAVYSLLKIDQQQFIESLCQSSLMTRGETVTKLNTTAEAQQTRDAMAKSLYSRLFDWIIFAMNRYFRTELEFQPKALVNMRYQSTRDISHDRLSIRPKAHQESKKDKSNDLCSVAILDLFGFEAFDYNSYEQLCINIANEQLQYFFRQHTFAWEIKEYENEGISKTIDVSKFDFPNNRAILDMCLSKPIGLFALLDEESRFPQSTDFTLMLKWRQNIVSTHFIATPTSNSLSRKSSKRHQSISLDSHLLFTITHYAGQIEYSAADFLEKNRDYVPMEILDLLLQSDDDLVSLLFRSRLRKTGSAIYTDREKQESTSSLSRKSFHHSATSNRTQGTVSTYFRYSLMELVSSMASTQPTFVRCLVPNRFPSSVTHVTYDHSSYFPQNFTFDGTQFDDDVVLEQIRYSGLLETIEIRRRGFSYRVLYGEFTSIYSCLLGFDDHSTTNIDEKKKAESILEKFRFKEYALGKTKLFLKFYHVDQLNLARKLLLTKIIRLQSRTRMFLVRKQERFRDINVVNTEYEVSVTRLQAIVRGFLVRCAHKKAIVAAVAIQAYFRMWCERTRFRRRLFHYHNQQNQVSYFIKQIELFGQHSVQQLSDLGEAKPTLTNGEKVALEREPSVPKIVTQSKSISSSQMNGKRQVAVLCAYYDAVHKDYLQKKKKNTNEAQKPIVDNIPPSTGRPSTAPAISTIPQAPPCPPPEFFKQTSNDLRIVKRQTSAPATVNTPIEELNQLFAARKSKQSIPFVSSMSFRPVSPPVSTAKIEQNLLSSAYLHVNNSKDRRGEDNDQPRRRLSSSSSIIQGKSTGLFTSSTSSLVGDLVLTSGDVIKLKENLRKTGFTEGNRTLRRKLPSESIQVDFRSVLRPSRSSMAINVNK